LDVFIQFVDVVPRTEIIIMTNTDPSILTDIPRMLKHFAVVQAKAMKVSQKTYNEQVQEISLLESYGQL
jgi:hypothetical protein